jgi:hypothetical protein
MLAPRRLPGGGEQMGDDVLWISLAEALNYIATESELGDSGKSGSCNEKFESDVIVAGPVTGNELGREQSPEQARFSKPPAPDGIHLSLLGAATEALKEAGRRGLKCRGTHPVTKERVEIEPGDWPELIIPVEAAFDAEGKLLEEVKGVTRVAYLKVTVDGLDLERLFPRSSIEKTEPAEREATRYQRVRTVSALKELYPPDGTRPDGVSIKMVTKRINKLPQFKNVPVSEDTVRRAFQDIKADLEDK